MADNPNEPVFIKHPDVDSIGGPVPRHAFETVWRSKGWTEVPATAVAASSILGRDVTDLNRLGRDDLDNVARNLGFDPSNAKTKDEVIGLIEGHPATTPTPAGGNA